MGWAHGGGGGDLNSNEYAAEIRLDPNAGNLRLGVSNSKSSAPTSTLTINYQDNVGIGTSSPSSNLHISSGTSGDAVLKLESDTDNSNEGDNSRIELLQDGGAHGAFIGFNSNWSGSESDNLFRIVARRSNTNDDNAFVIKTMGSGPNLISQVGIGTTTPSHKLSVAGTINSEEIIVEENVGADFVFEDSYDLPSLQDIEAFIEQNQHLPGIAPASQMIEEGVKVESYKCNSQKIEELTLYVIEINKENKALREEVEALKQASN